MCEHYRAPKYHGPYVSGRCPDCGAWVKGISSARAHKVESVPERDVPRAKFVEVIDFDGDIHRGATVWDARFRQWRVQIGMTTYPLSAFRKITAIGREFETPWAGILPVHQ